VEEEGEVYKGDEEVVAVNSACLEGHCGGCFGCVWNVASSMQQNTDRVMEWKL
jgi:hypothetical protein